METKKILVPTNFSAPAFRALLHAAELAVRENAEIHLLHVINPGVWSYIASPEVHVMVPGAYQQFRQSKLEQLELTCRWLLERYQVTVTTAIREGSVSTQVKEYAHAIGADLVLLHAPKKLGFWSKLFGHTAGKIEAALEIPVITLMDTTEEVFNWNDVVIPVTDVVPVSRIRTIAALADKFRITIHFVALAMWEKAGPGKSIQLLLDSLKMAKARSSAPVVCREIPGHHLLEAARSYAEKIKANAMMLYNKKQRNKEKDMLALDEQFQVSEYPYLAPGML
jgi:nucleotide-binding universal stress UspA family protein